MTTVAGQVVEFVRALALGWKNLAAYPAGHPVLINSLGLIHKRLAELRGPAGDISLGIVRDGLLYGQEKIDSTYAQKFGNALYTRGVAILRFDSDTDVGAIEKFLRMIGGSAADAKRPIWEELTAAGIVSIHLQPVDYSDVKVSDDLAADAPKNDAEELWEEILRAVMAGRELTPEGRRLLGQKVRSASELAAMIMQYIESLEQAAEFDPNATFGVRMIRIDTQDSDEVGTRMADAIGSFVAGSTGSRRQVAVQQAVELLKSLPESVRGAVMRSVMRALASEESAGPLLRDFVANLPQDRVLDTLRYLSDTMTLSTHAMRLVESLIATAKPALSDVPASPEVIADVVHLFGEDDIDRFNPDDHRELLDQVSVHIPDSAIKPARPISDLGDRFATMTPDAVNHQLYRTLLDLVRTYGPVRAPWSVLERIEEVFRAEIALTHFKEAVEIARDLQEIAITATNPALQDAIHQTFDKLGSGETLRGLIDTLHSQPEKTREIDQLLEVLGTAATKNLLLALAEENNRSRRRRLLNFVTSLGTVIVPEVKPFLTDTRWYVVRNMIVLLRAINDQSLLPDIRKCATHPDMRVRMEAIKALIALEKTPPKGLLEEAIRDPDPKLAEKAIILAGNYGIKEAVDPLLQIVEGNDMFGARRMLRLRAIHALGELAEPAALTRLERFFSDSFLPWPSRAERRAAYESLATYPANVRDPLVERGLRSRDGVVREICRKIVEPH